MPVQKGRSELFARYGQKLVKAVAAHAEDEVDYGFERLPPGITNGVAKLIKCEFGKVAPDKQNAGEFYFRAEGMVIEPREVTTPSGPVQVVGKRTSIFRMVCDTKAQNGKVTTMDENVAWISNEMKKLGAKSVDDLEATAEALVEAGPYFHFSTSQSAPTPQFPNPRIWENWNGSKDLQDYVPPDEEAFEDDTVPGDNGQAPSAHRGKHTPFNEFAKPEKVKVGQAKSKKTAQPNEDDEDLDALAEAATDDDEGQEARDQLIKLAGELGISEKKVEKAQDWDEVVEMIQHARAESVNETDEEGDTDAEESDEEGTDWAPAVEEVYPYRPIDPKTKKPVKRAVDCEVVAVNEKARTVTLKSLDNPKAPPYKNISWDELAQPE